MKKDMLISVIVPVYNTEKYLRECIESIIRQTYEMLEIILVDDGSTDTSSNICDEYANKDGRIIVIHQENRGLVAARKTGVSRATGKYVTFVDSDDWIAKDAYDKLMTSVGEHDIDIVSFGYTMVASKWKKEIYNLFNDAIYEGELLKILYSKAMYDNDAEASGITRSLCTKLIRRELVQEKLEQMDEKITLGEDAAVVYDSCLSAKSIMIKNIAPYYYRIHSESMCKKEDIDVFSRIYLFQAYMKNVFEKEDPTYGLLEQLKKYVFEFIRQGLENNFQLKMIPLLDVSDIKNCNIVLYGAGKIGQSYYRQLQDKSEINLVTWVDKNNFGQTINGCVIESPNILDKLEYDIILIAVKDKKIADEIMDELKDCGIDLQKVIWSEARKRRGQWLIE